MFKGFGTPSPFLSPAAAVFLISSLDKTKRGCIKGPGFSPNQRSVFRAKPPPGAFCTKEPGVTFKNFAWLASFRASLGWMQKQAVSRFFLEVRNQLLPSCDYHVLSGVWHCVALYAEGSPKL